MKKLRLLKTARTMVLAALLSVMPALGQTDETATRESAAGPIASQVLEKIMAARDRTPLGMYPPGYLKRLEELGDNPVWVSELTPEKTLLSRSPMRDGPQQDDAGPTTPMYHVVDLGTLGNDSFAYAINNDGQVVGYFLTNHLEHAFLHSSGSMQDILGGGIHKAFGINNHGQIVGFSGSGNFQHAFSYLNGSIQDLGTLGGLSIALGVSDNGQVVGYSSINGGWVHAFLCSSNVMQDLNPPSSIGSTAFAINNNGQVVGEFYITNNMNTHAVVYSNGLIRDLGTLGGNNSQGLAINDIGQVIGTADTSNGLSHAFLCPNDTMQDLGTLGGPVSYALAINNNGQIVGSSVTNNGGDLRAFFYWNGVMHNLNDLIAPTDSGWILQSAQGINDNGQIVGYGINGNGQNRAFRLDPILPGSVEAISNAVPIWPTYGSVTAEADKDHLIVVTHGFIDTTPEEATAWVDTMTNALVQYLNLQGMTNWQVVGYKWTGKAQGYLGELLTGKILENAKEEGQKFGASLTNHPWSHIHFIAHSAGANLIHTASQVVTNGLPGCTIHCTFLDPFVGVTTWNKYYYGEAANWSDCYLSSDWLTGGKIIRATDSALSHAYNADVTQLHQVADGPVFCSLSGDVSPSCHQAIASHGWPVDFYQNTITGNVTSGYDGFGFPLSMEGGNWDFATISYAKGGWTNLVATDADCMQLNGTVVASSSSPYLSNPSSITKGAVTVSGGGVGLVTASPSWIATFVTLTNPANALVFDSYFTSTNGARGLFTVFMDGNPIGLMDETAVASGLQNYTFSFPQTSANTTHVLGFRLDPYTNTQSSVILTNIALVQVGVSQPFSLSMTTNTFGGLRVLRLTGQAGFNYTVQASSNLLNWDPIALLVNTNGIVDFVDYGSTNYSKRFYRAVAPF